MKNRQVSYAAEMEPVEIFVTRPDCTGNLSVKPGGDGRVDRRKLSIFRALDRPVDRQKLQHLDQITVLDASVIFRQCSSDIR